MQHYCFACSLLGNLYCEANYLALTYCNLYCRLLLTLFNKQFLIEAVYIVTIETRTHLNRHMNIYLTEQTTAQAMLLMLIRK